MWDIVGHDEVVRRLQTALATDRLPQSLLFAGPPGIGKTAVAIELAKTLNCTGGRPPCQTCVHCHQIAGGMHPDVAVIDPAEGKDTIAIQQIRALREEAALRPFQGKRKVYIVAGAEALTAQAADALLKTLEEPHPQVTLVLTVADVDAVPATVASRCCVVPMSTVPAEAIADRLSGMMDAVEAERIARLARGRAGWALRAAKQPRLVARQEHLIATLSRVPELDLDERLRLAEELVADRKDRGSVRRALEILLGLARDMLISGGSQEPVTAPGGQTTLPPPETERLRLARAHAYVRGIRTAMERVDQNVDPRLAIEALLVSTP